MEDLIKNLVAQIKDKIEHADNDYCEKFIKQCVEAELGHYEQQPYDTCKHKNYCEFDSYKECKDYLDEKLS